MTIDPMIGVDIAPTEPRRRPDEPIRDLNDPLDRELASRDVEERSPSFWLPVAIAAAILIGVVYYFFSSPSNADVNMRADSAVSHSEPSPH